jgi:HK97 family phage prohead protease
MAVLSSSARDNLPDSAFAYIEPGGKKVNGKTVPGSLRHYPVHDAAHVRNALARAGQGSRFAKEAMPKILAAAKRHGVEHDSAGTGRSLDSLLPEVRFLADIPEIRSIGDGQPPHITGYAAAFGKLSRRLGGFVERVMPTAFNESRDAGWPDVVCRYNHDPNMVLGTTGSGTLSLAIDERGLHYDVLPPECRSDVVEYVQRGDVRYSSFAFRCMVPGEDDEWGVSDFGFPMRSLHKVQTVDTAPVLDPAYRDTSAVARNMTGAVESLAMWVDAEPAEVRSMLEAGQAIRLFKRSDRPVPKPAPVPETRESGMLDDPQVALRHWTYVAEEEAAGEERAEQEDEEQREHTAEEILEHAEESRAMHNADTMCRKYVDGEPCVMGSGHDGDCTGRCYSRPNGLPCAMAAGHHGAHTPMEVDDGAGRGPGRPRNRDAGETEAAAEAEKRTLTGPEALAAVFAMREQLTVID